ncbi:MAG TPA: hypothetical protein VIH18_05830 [Candidatus Binatia bacterium]
MAAVSDLCRNGRALLAGWMAVWTKRFWINATDLSLLVRPSPGSVGNPE